MTLGGKVFAMARGSRKTKMLRHVRLYHYLMQTEAWQSLRALERSIYIEIAARYAGDGSNNGRIGYSIREAASTFRVGKSSAARALEKLQDRGFIVARKKGAFSLKSRHSTEWRLTEFGCDLTSALPTKEFARWLPENQKPVPPGTLTVPEKGPIGIYGGTGHSKRPSTVSLVGPRKTDSSVLGTSGGTHIGYQGDGASPKHDQQRAVRPQGAL
jgi:DNA-binding MarR family transcriptional regulator